jgi:hypothetical protein
LVIHVLGKEYKLICDITHLPGMVNALNQSTMGSILIVEVITWDSRMGFGNTLQFKKIPISCLVQV